MFEVVMIYIALGIVAGMLSGLLGVGGGVIVVPSLFMTFQALALFPASMTMHIAIGSSFMIMVCTTAMSSWAHIRHHLVSWPLLKSILPSLCLGLMCGLSVGPFLSSVALRWLFAAFLIGMAVYLFFFAGQTCTSVQNKKHRSFFILRLLCASIGFLSGLFGVGGGVLLVPLLLKYGETMHHATGTTVVCALPMSLMGALVSFMIGYLHQGAAQHLTGLIGYIYWPAVLGVSFASIVCVPIGTHLSILTSERLLKRIFALLMMMTGLYLMYGGSK